MELAMMRRLAVVGDKLTNDGEICSYDGPRFLVGGHQAALIGGEAYCPVCKTIGYIAKDGGPRRMNFFINEIAAHDDVVICGCSTPPRIYARLAGEAHYDDTAEATEVEGLAAMAGDLAKSTHASGLADDHFDEQIHAVLSKGNLHGYPYCIELADGRRSFGRVTSGGMLPRMETGAVAGSYSVHWGDEALAEHAERK
jgi:hypothetical protein